MYKWLIFYFFTCSGMLCTAWSNVCLLLLWQIQQECQASIEEDGETLVIDGFRFESAFSREDLRRLRSQAAGGDEGCRGDTWLIVTLVVSSHKVNKVKRLAEVTMGDIELSNEMMEERLTIHTCSSVQQRETAVWHQGVWRTIFTVDKLSNCC